MTFIWQYKIFPEKFNQTLITFLPIWIRIRGFVYYKLSKGTLISRYALNTDLTGYICSRIRAGSTLHWVAWLDSTTDCINSTCCTGTDHATLKLGCEIVSNGEIANKNLKGKYRPSAQWWLNITCRTWGFCGVYKLML